MSDVVGAILAGGKGSRLGRSKATVPLAGRALIEYPLRALRDAELDTFVVAKPGTALPAIELPVWTEDADPVHPLLGVITALERSQGRPVLVCACDLPFVTPELAAWMAAREVPLAVPRAGGRLHPLFARYSAGLLPALRNGLERLAPLHETISGLEPLFLEERELAGFGDPERLLFNVNTPSDLAQAEAMLLIESLRRGFDSFSRGDISELLEFSSPDIVVYDAEELPGGEVHRGRDALRRGLEEWRSMFEGLRVEPQEFIPAGNRIVVVFRATAHGAGSGIPVDIELANVFTMNDGLVVEWRSYTSRAQALETIGLEG